MTEIEKTRLDDFKKILTFNIVTKISNPKTFNNNVNLFYNTPKIWQKFKSYSLTDNINPFKLIAMFNAVGLDRNNIKAIFGKYPNSTKQIPYSNLIKSDSDITTKNYGAFKSGTKIIHKTNVYLLPFDFINSIFSDKQLLEKVCDVGSDYYTKRQRRLILTQILGKKNNYFYVSEKEKHEKQELNDLIKELII